MATSTIPRAIEHVGESAGMQDHDRDLVKELAKRQEEQNIDRLRSLIRGEIKQDCF